MNTFIRQNDEIIPIEFVEDEHDENLDFLPSFWFANRRYYLKDFIRIHNNPWLNSDGIPEHITGMEYEKYSCPLFIELIDDYGVNVYYEMEG